MHRWAKSYHGLKGNNNCFFKKWGTIEEESYKALIIFSHHFLANSPTALPTVAGPPQNCLYLSKSACQTPRVFPHAHPPSLKAVPKHTTWRGCLCLYHCSQRRYDHMKHASLATSLESQACCWGAMLTFEITPTSCPSLLFWDTGRHTTL